MSRKKTNISECDLTKIGGRFAFIRLSNNLNQDDFSEKTGLSNGNISGIENHKYEPSFRALIKILEVFNVNSEWLLKGNGDMISQDLPTQPTGTEGQIGQVVKEQDEVVKKFSDQESASLANEYLLNMEKKSPKDFLLAVGYLKGVSDSIDRKSQDLSDRRKRTMDWASPERRKKTAS